MVIGRRGWEVEVEGTVVVIMARVMGQGMAKAMEVVALVGIRAI